jgi:CRP-like cAMP-binding protein
MAIDDDIAFLERLPVFRLLGKRALRVLSIGAENVYVHTGESLFRAGEAADGAVVVQEGSFRVTGDNARERLAGPGTLFDEYALFTETARSLTAVAREPSTVIRVPRSLFLRTLESHPDAARRLRDQVARRVGENAHEMSALRDKLEATIRSA